MGRMIIAVDAHKASVTIEVVDGEGKVAATGAFGTDSRSYRNLLTYARRSGGEAATAQTHPHESQERPPHNGLT